MKLLSVGSALLSGVLLLQAPSTPPIKMGLWDIILHTRTPNPPGSVPGTGDQTVHLKACYTLENYVGQVMGLSKSCVRAGETWTSSSYSGVVTCGKIIANFKMTFDSRESFTTSGTYNGQASEGQPPIHMESTSTAHFLSADCGSVMPDHPEIDPH